MRSQSWIRVERYVLGPLFGLIAVAGLTLLIHVGPSRLVGNWAMSASDFVLHEPEAPRDFIGSELLDIEASDDFADLLKAVAEMPERPTLESVHRLMERRGWTELRYILRLRHYMDDGGYDDIEYVRRPYQSPWPASEFLRLLKTARVTPEGIQVVIPGRDQDPRRVARYLWLEGIGLSEGE